MAGNSRSGRRPDPTKPTAPKPEGEPIRPEGLDGEAGLLWDSVVPWLVRRKLAGDVDSAALQTMCEMWGCYRRVYGLVSKTEPEAVLLKELRISLIAYQSAFEHWASRFGLTPADRARLVVAATSADDNPLSQFGIVG